MGTRLRGHEFHNSSVRGLGDAPCAYRLSRGYGLGGDRDGLVYKNVLASYTHLHALATPEWAPAMVAAALRRRAGRASNALPTIIAGDVSTK